MPVCADLQKNTRSVEGFFLENLLKGDINIRSTRASLMDGGQAAGCFLSSKLNRITNRDFFAQVGVGTHVGTPTQNLIIVYLRL